MLNKAWMIVFNGPILVCIRNHWQAMMINDDDDDDQHHQ